MEKAGRPPKYKTPEELQIKIQEYIDENKLTGLTITGLCYHCGFESRQSFYDLGNRDEFSYTIKRARLFIESSYELKLHDRTPAGAIFALKNLGWTDQQHITHDISYSEITDEELINRANKILTTGKESGAK